MTYSELKKRKRVQVLIEKLNKYVIAKVVIEPYFDDKGVFIKLIGTYNKDFDFEIHIRNKDDFLKYDFK